MKTNWQKVQLVNIATFINGRVFKESEWSSKGLPIIRIQNLTDPTKQYNYFSGKCENKYLVQNGDILISWSATLDIFEWKKNDAYLNQHIFKVVFNKVDIDKKYFKYAIKHSLNVMTREMHGATMKHITKTKFEAIQIPLPPLPIQKKIADALDKADEIRCKRQEAIDKLDELVQSVFLDMFGNFEKYDWQIAKLESVCVKVTDGTHQSPKFISDGIPFLFVSNLTNNTINLKTKKFIARSEYDNLTRNTKVESGDILYTTVGSYGHAAVVDIPDLFLFQRHIAHLKPIEEKVNSVFLHSLMLSPLIQKQADRQVRGIAQKTLNLRELKNFSVFIPPMELQLEYTALVNRLTIQQNQLSTDGELLDNLFNSLLQRAFKGELEFTDS